jgi:hypothetical protein
MAAGGLGGQFEQRVDDSDAEHQSAHPSNLSQSEISNTTLSTRRRNVQQTGGPVMAP